MAENHYVPVPEQQILQATVPGFAGVRYAYDTSEVEFVADYQVAMKMARPGKDGVAVLALSGGGANGAFGAGLLCGWSETGQRPEFQVVTGVSTGALAAPFAFLGPTYDNKLLTAYTKIRDQDIFHLHLWRSAFNFFGSDSLADTAPLFHTIAGLIDQKTLDDIAVEHRRGRRLYVCTTELVSGRAVFWNMTAIAASGRADALELFRKILVASASIPIAFPPQYIEVVAGGQRYTEMHVDGGLSRQVFLHLYDVRDSLPLAADGVPVPLTAYIIRNAKVGPEYAALKADILSIASRTVRSLVRAEGIGDLHRIHEQTVNEKAAFRLAVIPDTFSMPHHEMFDPEYMQNLFEVGRKLAKEGYPWMDKPPYYEVHKVRPTELSTK